MWVRDVSFAWLALVCWPGGRVWDSAEGGNLNSRSMVPCLVRGGPLFLVDFVSAAATVTGDAATGGSSASPPSSGVGSKTLRTGFGCTPELLGGEGPGDMGV